MSANNEQILNRNFTGFPKNYLSMVNKSTLELWEKYSKIDSTDVEVIEKSIVKHHRQQWRVLHSIWMRWLPI